MANNLHRYGIMIHRKGTSYDNDYWFTDNKRFQIREFSYEAAQAVLIIIKTLSAHLLKDMLQVIEQAIVMV